MLTDRKPPSSAPAPRLALVLGSGGVRSIAAVGIAEVLRAEGIGIDLVVGCSSGALFGATIAMGMPSDETLATAMALWSDDLTRQRRWRAYLQMLAPRLAGFGAGFALRDDRLIAERVARAFGEHRLESLPTPLRVCATEASSGEPVVLTRGSLVEALRASMALPFLFPSVEVDGRQLVDGVISDPLPVSAASDAGAIVALGFRGPMPRRVDRPSRLLARVSTAMTNNLMQARVATARASGQRLLSLELRLDRHVGLWQTEAMAYLFEVGRRTARASLPQIAALLEPVGGRAAA
ncbi:MAG: patatin-like phospholipase family protein [Burkholderiales bacterium]|nr:patatin-like phospholipase family protein [Burkholderiales bacterium]